MDALQDSRNREVPVPDNLADYLNEAQLRALRRVEDFGWELKFIRRPLFQDVVAIVVSHDGTRYGLLDEDGGITMDPDLAIR